MGFSFQALTYWRSFRSKKQCYDNNQQVLIFSNQGTAAPFHLQFFLIISKLQTLKHSVNTYKSNFPIIPTSLYICRVTEHFWREPLSCRNQTIFICILSCKRAINSQLVHFVLSFFTINYFCDIYNFVYFPHLFDHQF